MEFECTINRKSAKEIYKKTGKNVGITIIKIIFCFLAICLFLFLLIKDIVGYESISNYYKLKHYYFFLIITNEVIPIFVDKKSLTNEEMEKLELLVQQKMPQLKNQTAKTIKQRFAFYNLHSQGDLYGM